MKTLQDAYDAGRDCAVRGPNTTNCHFTLFATAEMTKEWERGKREAERLTGVKEERGMPTEFRDELEHLINRFSLENASNTPGIILAQFIQSCLEAFDRAVQQREAWYGRDPRPSQPFADPPAQEEA